MDNQYLQMSATSIVALFETTKVQRKTFVVQILEAVETGSINPLELHLQIKSMEDIIKQITSDDDYKQAVLDETLKHGRKFEFHNAEVSVKEAGISYDYESCGDSKIIDLYSKMKKLKSQITERETFLKNIPTTGQESISEDGVIESIKKPIKTSTTVTNVILK